MVVVSAVHIATGWVWHTVYQARHHWRLKREGALTAAALIAAIGVVEGIRTAPSAAALQPDHYAAAATQPITVSSSPVLTEGRVDVVPGGAAAPAGNASALMASGQPVLDFGNVAPEDMLPPEFDEPNADQIIERVGQHDMTASIPRAEDVEQPATAAAPVAAPVKKVVKRQPKRVDQIAELLSGGRVVKTEKIVSTVPAKATAKPDAARKARAKPATDAE